jgi:hypothetical protein
LSPRRNKKTNDNTKAKPVDSPTPLKENGDTPYTATGYNAEEYGGSGKVEDTETENDVLINGDYPYSLSEITALPSDEDSYHLIDYLMGHTNEEQQP